MATQSRTKQDENETKKHVTKNESYTDADIQRNDQK